MGKLLTALGVSPEQQNILPASVFKGEGVIYAMQSVYASVPDSPKKDRLAVAIAEAVKILMAKVQPYLVDEVKEQQVKKEDEKLPQEEPTPEKPTEIPKPEKPTPTPPMPPSEQPKKAPKPSKEKPKESNPPKQQEQPKSTDEPMTCEEIKDAIKGLSLIAKMGDLEATQIIKELKIKLKTQNCK